MYLVKALNNNTALVKENSQEFIVMGSGIAFNKKKNDVIDEKKIEKKYHLSLALKRAKENLYFGTPLEWDIKLIYPNEYRYALRCVNMINQTMDLKIPEQEASFIALHFINASANKKIWMKR